MKRNLLKKSYEFMLLCSLSLLLMVSISSCQQSKLKAVVAIANKQCPIDMGELGAVTSVIYDETNVVYTLSINETFTNIAVLRDNPESMKESTKVMFQNPQPDIKKMLDLMLQCNAGLQMIFVGKDSGEEATCTLTPEEIKEALYTESTPEQSNRTKLETQVKMANLQFPMQASQEIEIEKVEIEDESVAYICRVDEDLCPIDQIEANGEDIKEGIVSGLAQADPATQQFIQSCVNNNKNIAYRYIGTTTGEQYEVIITVPELEEMIIEN